MKALGRRPTRSDTRALLFSRFAAAPPVLPSRTHFWPRRRPFSIRTFGNTEWNNCTRAKQAIAMLRMERIETRSTATIDDAEPIRVYQSMIHRLYNGEDAGAYETDALSEWRKPDLTFRDTKGRALTIDAYLRLNPFDHTELKSSLVTAGAHGLAVCLNLPWAFAAMDPPMDWDIPADQPPVGHWAPGTWGGHSMWAVDYDEVGLWLVHTWGMADQRITWRAASIYLDEAHMVIDSYDYWRTQKPEALLAMDLVNIRREVNRVSSTKIA